MTHRKDSYFRVAKVVPAMRDRCYSLDFAEGGTGEGLRELQLTCALVS